MNKKAASTLVMIFELIAVIAIIFILISYANNLAGSKNSIKVRAAGDIQMMINTLVGISGAAIVEYPHDMSNYSLALNNKEQTITIFETKKSTALKTYQSFHLPAGYSASGAVKNTKRVCLTKKEKTVTLRKCLKQEKTTKTSENKNQ